MPASEPRIPILLPDWERKVDEKRRALQCGIAGCLLA